VSLPPITVWPASSPETAPTMPSSSHFSAHPLRGSAAVGTHASATPGSSQTAAATSADNSPDERKLHKAAGDFESILLATLWKGMKEGLGDDQSSSDPAHGTLEDWGIEIMASAVGRAGGLGIGKLILEHLDPKVHPNSSQTVKGL
jgi:Rod binding domain-containing protein